MDPQLGKHLTAREAEVPEDKAAGVSLRGGREEQEQGRSHTR
jgi:hypothetical protein